MTHELHVGYQLYVDSEDLIRSSNGWGSITVPGGRSSFNGTRRSSTRRHSSSRRSAASPPIHSEYRSQSFEVNDTIRWNNFDVQRRPARQQRHARTGQGLREDGTTLSGYTLGAGNKYQMYEIPFSKMIQPRVGATWAYNGTDTIYASYAKYNPAASSLPRAASWDRNLASHHRRALRRQRRALRDDAGRLLVGQAVRRRT